MSDSDITTEVSSEQVPTPPPQDNQDQPKLPGDISFNIWPPTQRTRDAVINRLIETLSTPSVLSKRYGTMPSDEASAAARQIEDEAFAAAGGSVASDGDGIEILQVYSKEISKRMLETVKARTTAGSAAVENGADQAPPSDHPPSSLTTTEDAPATTEADA